MEPEEARETRTGSELVLDSLQNAGIEIVFGLPGTQTLPLDQAITQRDGIEYVMGRDEKSLPHMAWGYYEASEKVAATLTIPGPGDTNAMHGLKNAYEDCVPLVHVSADVDPSHRGQSPIHEIPADTYDNVVKENLNVTSSSVLAETVARALAVAETPPMGPVRLGVPNTLLATEIKDRDVNFSPETVSYDNEVAISKAARLLQSADKPLLYVGGGARRSPRGCSVVQRLADKINIPVLSTYKGKGVLPEDNPRFLGVSGKHLPESSKEVLKEADVVLALGTDFDGVTTDSWRLPMGSQHLIHVNIDTTDMNESYSADVCIVGDVSSIGERLLTKITDAVTGQSWDGANVATEARDSYLEGLRTNDLLSETPVKTPGALRTIRKILPSNAVVTTDIGGFRLWAKQTFRATGQHEYITAGSWAGMGVGLPAAVGAKTALPDRDVVSLIGDGGLLMCLGELHTAVENDLNVVVIVFNNSDYGIISQTSNITRDLGESHFSWKSPEFRTIAEGFGCRSRVVESRTKLAEAVEEALHIDETTLIDLRVPTNEISVFEAASE